MKQTINLAIIVSLGFMGSFPVYSRGFIGIGTVGMFEQQVGPELLSPASEEVDIFQKDSLEFRWLRRSLIGVDHYDFKLYKGYNMYASDLIFQQKVPYQTGSIEVKTTLFEANQVYTWSLVRVSDNGNKSDKSFYSFRAIKK